MTTVLKAPYNTKVSKPRVSNKDLPEITSIPGDEIDNIKIEH